ncbi:MAG TPA: hypothetical protein GXX57_01160 [Firmicutes bacterium]|jgi:Na+-transporting methylmalonyl-CoA/oxaloacetate decarboxylase gamma subunit|nr:hypothetical protein [Bacillota bacterium]
MSQFAEALLLTAVGIGVVMACMAIFVCLLNLTGYLLGRSVRQREPAVMTTAPTEKVTNQPEVAAIVAVLSTVVDPEKIKSMRITKDK